MKQYHFPMSNGFYCVDNSDEKKDNLLSSLQSLREDLVKALPHRRTNIDSFIIACVDEILLQK